MELRISELKLRPDHTREELEREIRHILRIRGATPEYEIMRRSVDAVSYTHLDVYKRQGRDRCVKSDADRCPEYDLSSSEQAEESLVTDQAAQYADAGEDGGEA